MTTYEQMREALKLCGSQMCKFCKGLELARSMHKKEMLGVYCHPDKCEALRALRAALAVPPRNCDRFGGDIDKLREACARERGLNPEEDFPEIFCEWLLAAAKKGGAK